MHYPVPYGLFSLFLLGTAFCRPVAQANETGPSPLRIACVGDSITYGAGLAGRETNSYPARLERDLGPSVTVGNFGVNSATLLKKGDLPYWDQPEYQAALDFAPDLVVILLGTNDAHPLNWRHKSEFADDLTALIERFRATPRNPEIWLAYPPPLFGVFRSVLNINLSGEIIPLIEQVARKEGRPTIDLYTALRPYPEFFPDNVHPDDRGAKIIADTVRKALEKSRRLVEKKKVQTVPPGVN